MNEHILQKILEYKYYKTWCVLEDCNRPNCHHCFPIKNCIYEHEYCKKVGECTEYVEVLIKKICN